MLVAAVPALATGETDIMRIIVGFGLGVPALLVLILSTWTINAANLYSASLSLTATFPRVNQWKFTLLAGACGSLLAVAGIIDSFVSFLLVLGIIIPPIAAIYVIDAFNSYRTETALRWPAIVTWLFSVAIALLAYAGYFTLTTVPALDATLAATAIHGGWMYARRRRAHGQASRWSSKSQRLRPRAPCSGGRASFLAGPLVLLCSLLLMGGAHLWLPPGAGGVNHIVLPILLYPAIWTGFFFYACFERRIWRGYAVVGGLIVLHAVVFALHIAVFRHDPAESTAHADHDGHTWLGGNSAGPAALCRARDRHDGRLFQGNQRLVESLARRRAASAGVRNESQPAGSGRNRRSPLS